MLPAATSPPEVTGSRVQSLYHMFGAAAAGLMRAGITSSRLTAAAFIYLTSRRMGLIGEETLRLVPTAI